MKKLFFVALFALTAVISSAQKVTYNVQGGANLSTLTDVASSRMKVGFQLGAGLDYAFRSDWSLQSSLLIISRGCKIGSKGFSVNGNHMAKGTFSPVYLELPVNLAYKFDLNKDMKFFVNGGLYFEYGLFGKYKQDDASYNLFGSNHLSSSIGNFKRFQTGVGLGCGVELSKYIISLRQEFGWSKASKRMDSKNETTSLSVAYKF